MHCREFCVLDMHLWEFKARQGKKGFASRVMGGGLTLRVEAAVFAHLPRFQELDIQRMTLEHGYITASVTGAIIKSETTKTPSPRQGSVSLRGEHRTIRTAGAYILQPQLPRQIKLSTTKLPYPFRGGVPLYVADRFPVWGRGSLRRGRGLDWLASLDGFRGISARSVCWAGCATGMTSMDLGSIRGSPGLDGACEMRVWASRKAG